MNVVMPEEELEPGATADEAEEEETRPPPGVGGRDIEMDRMGWADGRPAGVLPAAAAAAKLRPGVTGTEALAALAGAAGGTAGADDDDAALFAVDRAAASEMEIGAWRRVRRALNSSTSPER